MKKIILLFFLLAPAVVHAAGGQSANVNMPIVSYIAIGVAFVLLFLLIVLWRMLDSVRNRVDDLEMDVENILKRIPEEFGEKFISREEVEVLIVEQVASVVIDVKGPEVSAGSHEKLFVPEVAPHVIFFGRPTGERMFDDNKKCMKMTENTYYRFSLLKNDEENAIVEFCPNHTGAIKALDNRAKTIEPVCELTVKGEKPQNYRCEKPGRAVMKNGFWTVIRKAKVVYE